MRGLKGVERAGELSGERSVVKVDHAYRHLFRLPLIHQRCEKHRDEDGKHHHTEHIDRIGYEASALAFSNEEDA